MAFHVLVGCPLDDTMAAFFASHLSESIEDYPEGIVIPLDKPLRWTSADVVRKVKFQLQRHFRSKKLKVGHAGTLDPMATGLLMVCAGKATKVAEQLQSHEKEYIARMEFGATTASYDLEQPVSEYFPYRHITPEKVREALQGFIGEQEQVPPVFSAKMVGGLRAYEYARTGEPVELSKSQITIFSMELLDWIEGTEGPAQKLEAEYAETVKHLHNYHTAQKIASSPRPQADIRIRCSKGTYIRSIARDLGLALGSGAYLTALRRISSGEFKVEE